jgi:hypothetical protein
LSHEPVHPSDIESQIAGDIVVFELIQPGGQNGEWCSQFVSRIRRKFALQDEPALEALQRCIYGLDEGSDLARDAINRQADINGLRSYSRGSRRDARQWGQTASDCLHGNRKGGKQDHRQSPLQML